MSFSGSPTLFSSPFTPRQVKLVEVSMVALTIVSMVMTVQQSTVTVVMEQSLGSNASPSVMFVVFCVVSVGASPRGASPNVSWPVES